MLPTHLFRSVVVGVCAVLVATGVAFTPIGAAQAEEGSGAGATTSTAPATESPSPTPSETPAPTATDEPTGEKMPTDKLVDVSPLALRMSSPFNAGYWLAAA